MVNVKVTKDARAFLCQGHIYTFQWIVLIKVCLYLNIVAAFKGIYVSPAKHSYACLPRKCDCRTDRHTDGQTDAGQSDPYVLLCFVGDNKLHFAIKPIWWKVNMTCDQNPLSYNKWKTSLMTCTYHIQVCLNYQPHWWGTIVTRTVLNSYYNKVAYHAVISAFLLSSSDTYKGYT